MRFNFAPGRAFCCNMARCDRDLHGLEKSLTRIIRVMWISVQILAWNMCTTEAMLLVGNSRGLYAGKKGFLGYCTCCNIPSLPC